MLKVNGCEIARNRGRGFLSYSVYTPRGEHFAEMDTHVHVVYSREEAITVAKTEPRAPCASTCDCRED